MSGALGSLDRRLEEAGVLGELQPPAPLSALETQEFKQVGGCGAGACTDWAGRAVGGQAR